MRTAAPLFAAVAAVLLAAAPAAGQKVGREAATSLRFPPLHFKAPEAQSHEIAGVKVFLLEDHSLPLVSLYARFDGGFSNYPREYYAAATALPGLLRSGGTTDLSPDSVDELMEFYAIQTAFGSGGEASFSSLNTLKKHLDVAFSLWTDMLRHPRFDSAQVEVWRGQELESVLRRRDDPGRLAFSEFNHLVFGDHPIGWEMTAADLTPERLSTERLTWLHRHIFCPGNLVLGVTGDATWAEVEPLLARMLDGWARCPAPVPDSPKPRMRDDPGIYLIPRKLDQTTVVMAEPGTLSQSDDPDYYASRIGNSILGASGFTSRLMDRVRTQKGYAYSASSLWTAPTDYEGLVGALTRTKSASTVAAIRLILSTMDEMTKEPPTEEEVSTAIKEIVNGFVFNFQTPSQVVSREMVYSAEGLPKDWLDRYVDGVQDVTPSDVLRVFRRYVDPSRMMILVLGDPAAFDQPLDSLGPVHLLDVAEPSVSDTAGALVSAPPRGGPRFRR